jgi:hypothetical protein
MAQRQFRGGQREAHVRVQFRCAGIDDAAATWHTLGGMDLWERLTETTSSSAVDGNLPENQNLLGGTISDAMWLDQGLLTLRWTDFNDTGNDGMYALDNFSMSGISAVPEPSVYALGTPGVGAVGIA